MSVNFADFLLNEPIGFNDTSNATNDSVIDGVKFNNESTLKVPVRELEDLVKVITLLTMASLSIIGNSVTLYVIYRTREPAFTIKTLITNLAVSDLMVTCFCMVVDASWAYSVSWKAGNGLCKFVKFMQVFSLYASTYVCVLIAVDRCHAVLGPMNRVRAPLRLKIMLSVVWFGSAVLALPQVFLFRVLRAPFEDVVFYQCVTGYYTAEWQEKLYGVGSFVLLFLLPLCIIVICYSLIFFTIAKESGNCTTVKERWFSARCNGHTSGRRHIYKRAKRSSLLMSVVIVAAFIVCWSPYYIVMIGYIFKSDIFHTNTDLVFAVVFPFGMANSMINPVIYGAFHLARRRCCWPPDRRNSQTNNSTFFTLLTSLRRKRRNEADNEKEVSSKL